MVKIEYAADKAPHVSVSADDPFLPHLLRDYAARCGETGAPTAALQARKMADEVMLWQDAHPAKASKKA